MFARCSTRTGSAAPPPEREQWEPEGFEPAVDRLARLVGLTPFERQLLLLTAAVELDGDLAALVAALQDGADPRPTFGLALAALPGAHWDALAPRSPLRRWRLVEPLPGPTLASRPLRIDERVLHHLTGLDAPDERLAGTLRVAAAVPPLAPSQRRIAEELARTAAGAGSRVAVRLDGEDTDARARDRSGPRLRARTPRARRAGERAAGRRARPRRAREARRPRSAALRRAADPGDRRRRRGGDRLAPRRARGAGRRAPRRLGGAHIGPGGASSNRRASVADGAASALDDGARRAGRAGARRAGRRRRAAFPAERDGRRRGRARAGRDGHCGHRRGDDPEAPLPRALARAPRRPRRSGRAGGDVGRPRAARRRTRRCSARSSGTSAIARRSTSAGASARARRAASA